MNVLTEEVIASFKDAAQKLTGAKRRAFEAQVTLDYLGGSVWKAERVFRLVSPYREARVERTANRDHLPGKFFR